MNIGYSNSHARFGAVYRNQPQGVHERESSKYFVASDPKDQTTRGFWATDDDARIIQALEQVRQFVEAPVLSSLSVLFQPAEDALRSLEFIALRMKSMLAAKVQD